MCLVPEVCSVVIAVLEPATCHHSIRVNTATVCIWFTCVFVCVCACMRTCVHHEREREGEGEGAGEGERERERERERVKDQVGRHAHMQRQPMWRCSV